MPIDRSMYSYHSDTWPRRELAKFETGAVQVQRLGFQQAEGLLDEFETLVERLKGDKHLSHVGVRDALQKWAQEKLPALTGRLERIRKETAEEEAQLVRKMTEKLLGEGDDHGPEIRAWLSRMPNDSARLDAIGKLASKGDLSALRAALRAPAYLSAVPEDELVELRNDALKQHDPRFGMLDAMRRGADSSTKAIGAAIKGIEEQLQVPAPRGPAPVPVPPKTPEQIAADREAAARINDIIRQSNSPEVLAALGMDNDAPSAA